MTTAVPLRFVIVTLDNHIAGAVEHARRVLRAQLPGLQLSLHVAANFSDEKALQACCDDIAQGDIVFANMLFIDEHIAPLLPVLTARKEACDAMICAMSAGEIMKQTRMGSFRMDGSSKGPLALLKKLRGKNVSGSSKDGGAGQMALLKTLPRLLRFVPGKAQDLRNYFLILAYWLSGSSENIAELVRLIISRYADGPRKALRAGLNPQAPKEYPENGVYHPSMLGRLSETSATLPCPEQAWGTVGVVVLRSYVLAEDAGHYDSVIRAFEARGLKVIAAFASGLDARPTMEKFFFSNGRPIVDAVVSLTGFSLVGGPAFNDAKAAEEMLATLDVPYISAQPLEFQSIKEWQGSSTGFTPFESTIMMAIPELDGATSPVVFGGRMEKPRGSMAISADESAEGAAVPAGAQASPMVGIEERVERLSARVARIVRLRQSTKAERKIAIVLFNFPPNGGATGTAAYLSVFESLLATLKAMQAEGYTVNVPASAQELSDRIVVGNSPRYGTDANVHHFVGVEEHVAKEPYLDEIEKAWGPAPGKQLSDGRSIFVMGASFGNVFVGIQPSFGYEGDPMRLLFESGFAPTHAFSAFYRYLDQTLGVHAVLHFGTHGALEFMPGKQTGVSGSCWPDRLIGTLPNLYLYAANNPSEGALARRRASATLVSYLTPPVTQAGLYKGLLAVRETLDRYRSLPPGDPEAPRLVQLLQAQAAAVDLARTQPAWSAVEGQTEVASLVVKLTELEQALIPCGLHILGQPMAEDRRIEYLVAMAEGSAPGQIPAEAISSLAKTNDKAHALRTLGKSASEQTLELIEQLERTNHHLTHNQELPQLMRALDGKYIRPAPGGDLLRNPSVLPTGRNVHGFDPFAIPSAFALLDGAEQASRLLARHVAEGHPLPESVAVVLWGADNLKSGGGPIAQALALFGAKPRFDSYGRLSGAELLSLEQLGRPRIDVMITLSGIFRDLLPLQTRLLAEAAYLAALADEPLEQNFVRRHALAHQQKHGCDLETAALRVFSNGDGAYGANVNALIDSGAWEQEDELADAFTKRKSFAFGRKGTPVKQEALMRSVLSGVQLAYQNLESVELGVSTLDHYFDTLGGIGRAVSREQGKDSKLAIYIGDQTQGEGKVRTLNEQVALESRTRSLNPKWAEEMLKHGAEGVRQIEAQVTNTLGWSATTGQVDEWVYRELAETYVLNKEMRERLSALNPKASLKLANRLIEATDRHYWQPDEATLEALRQAGDDLEDRLEALGSGLSPSPAEAA